MENLIARIREIIDFCWESYSAKVGGRLIDINKEASMQLNFAYILKNSIDLAVHHTDEQIEIELETGIPVNGRMRECDIVVKITKGSEVCSLPIELKCYKYLASSGGKRGAVDIFYKDVYADIELLEAYTLVENYLPGIQLTMTNFRNLPYPPGAGGKYLAYNISHGSRVEGGIQLHTPIGGRQIEITLTGTYFFDWHQVGEYYFLKLENNA